MIDYVQVPVELTEDTMVNVDVPAAPIVNVTVSPAAPPTAPETYGKPVVSAATSAVYVIAAFDVPAIAKVWASARLATW